MWAYDSIFYQIYPLGFCGAPEYNDGRLEPRLNKIRDWIPYLREMEVNALYLSPVFQSDRHGYDTRDYRTVDARLGTNDDLIALCEGCHREGIRIILDGVFHHVGRGFWAFQEVQRHRWDSPYKDWFFLRFDQNSPYNDGFSYQGWEGHYDLVRLNLRNPAVKEYLFSSVRFWIETFGIDGLRLDVAYSLDHDFLIELRRFCEGIRPDFFLVGEIVNGLYAPLLEEDACHSCTNYEVYKGLYSSLNDLNLFEIDYSLNRLFGSQNGALYPGKHLFSFVDNHDVNRIASVLKERKHLPLIYGMLFAIPGIPCLYYGSEWGAQGRKDNGSDRPLRPCFDAPVRNDLSEWVRKLAALRKAQKCLSYGDYRTLLIRNRQWVFERAIEGERITIAINAEGAPADVVLPFDNENVENLLTGENKTLSSTVRLEPWQIVYWKRR